LSLPRPGMLSLRSAARPLRRALPHRIDGSVRRAYGRLMTNAHAIDIGPFGGRVRVRVGGVTLADTGRAQLLEEGSLPPVFYIPREDVQLDRLTASATTSRCPFKGDAVYFSAVGGPADVAWSYETPLPAAGAIAGHLAFYPDKAEIETVPFG